MVLIVTVSADGPAQLRAQLRSSADPRVARTRATLFAAVRRLPGDGRDVTVSAVAAAAGVSRSVFYTHFEDLADLALQLIEPHLASVADYVVVQNQTHADPGTAMLDAQRRLTAFFRENRALFVSVLRAEPTRAVVVEGLRQALQQSVAGHLDRLGGVPAPWQADVVTVYFSAAAVQVVVAWLLGELVLDEEALAQHLFALMPVWLYTGPTTPSPSTAHEEDAP